MPKPHSGESKDDFMKRCMEQLVDEEGHERDQAYAICNSLWEEHDNKFEIHEPK